MKRWLLVASGLAVVGLAVVLLVQMGNSSGVPADQSVEDPKPIAPPAHSIVQPKHAGSTPAAKAPTEQPEAVDPLLSLSFGEQMRLHVKRLNLDPSKLPKVEVPYSHIKDPKERAIASVKDERKRARDEIKELEGKLAENERLKALSDKDVRHLKRLLKTARRTLAISTWRWNNLQSGIWPEPPFGDYLELERQNQKEKAMEEPSGSQ